MKRLGELKNGDSVLLIQGLDPLGIYKIRLKSRYSSGKAIFEVKDLVVFTVSESDQNSVVLLDKPRRLKIISDPAWYVQERWKILGKMMESEAHPIELLEDVYLRAIRLEEACKEKEEG